MDVDSDLTKSFFLMEEEGIAKGWKFFAKMLYIYFEILQPSWCEFYINEFLKKSPGWIPFWPYYEILSYSLKSQVISS